MFSTLKRSMFIIKINHHIIFTQHIYLLTWLLQGIHVFQMLVIRKLFEIMFQWHHYSIYIHLLHFLKSNLFSILKLHKNAMNGLGSNFYRTLIYKKYCLAAQYLHSENTTLRSISKSQLDSSIYIRIFIICWDNTV